MTAHDPKLVLPFMKYHFAAAGVGGIIYVAEDATQTIIAAALWFPPERTLFDR
jgi:hypothetical protein